MKKSKLVLLGLVALLGITGCGSNKNLTCTMDSKTSGLDTSSTVEIEFKKDSVESMKVTMEIEIPEEYEDQKETIIDAFEDQDMEVEETKKGIKVTADSESKYFDSFNIKDTEAKLEDVKELFEKQGYTCK